MRYYSDVTKKLYPTEIALHEGEAQYAKKQDEEAKKQKERAIRAKEVENALRKANEATAEYRKLLNAFCKDYGSFHMTFSRTTPSIEKSVNNSIEDLLDLVFKL